MTHEVELKFRIPPSRLAALRRAVATRSASQLPLAARYMETADGDLARARVALRLRLEGEVWVQTLKAEGRVALQRLEHNAPVQAPTSLRSCPPRGRAVPGGGPAGLPLLGQGTPELDLRRHDGTEAGERLREVLAAARNATLREHYATAITRTWRRLRHQGALIELALDEGEIRAGGLALPVSEIEFELVDGSAQALLDLAGRWAERHGLWLDVRSKSERGHALAREAHEIPEAQDAPDTGTTLAAGADVPRGQAISPPARARALKLPPGATPAQAGAAMLGDTLQQALANASQIADGGAGPEHLHQLRVGLRRLRTVLRVFPALLPGADAGLVARLSQLFAQLGLARDRDVRAATLWPALRAAGAPEVAEPEAAPSGTNEALPAVLRQAATQQLWLQLLALSLPQDTAGAASATRTAPATPAPTLADALAPALRRLLRQVRRDAQAFATLDDTARHRLRRRIKRLRYATELSAGLWPADRVSRFLEALAQAQHPLGELNDAVVAAAFCRTLAGQQPAAWFAVGWLAARHAAAVAACVGPMAALAVLRAPWRGGGKGGKPAAA